MNKYPTREEWLTGALIPIQRHFSAYNYTVPQVRLACGWPSHGGTAVKKRCLGEAWASEAASDGVIQIFISPYLADVTAPQGVLAILVHEVCHAVVGNKNGHNKVFGKCARAVGLEGKLTSTHASEKLIVEFKAWVAQLGEYPHAKLDAAARPTKKQSTRMVKMECNECGYICRTAKKWIAEVGPAHCPKHGEMLFDNPEDTDDREADNE